MARSTKRKIKTTQVSTNEIREVFNSDSSSRPIPQRIRRASDFFVDGNIANSIYNNFIDGEFCPAEGEGTKKDNLTAQPYSWGHWRNYGGNDLDEEFLPEIYWKNIIDFKGVDHAPQTQESINFYTENATFPGVLLAPPLSEDDVYTYVDPEKYVSLGLGSEISSVLHRLDSNSFEKYLTLNTKAGVDYSEGYSGGEPIFKIKVTPFLGDVDLGAFTLPAGVDRTDLFTVPITGAIGVAGARILTEVALDYFLGPFSPISGVLDIPLAGTALGPAAVFVTAAVASIFVADAIWDWAQPEAVINNSSFIYKQLVGGMYNFNDISDTKYKFGFGNKNVGYDNNLNGISLLGSFEKKIAQLGEEFEYSLTDFNYEGTPFSVSNLISEFPTNSSNRDKFLNMKFYPDGIQYDLDTPPPSVSYLVELIPVQNCKLSTTKPTKFLVNTPVHKYRTPKFDVITPNVYANSNINYVRYLYRNTPITFVNAKYCDFIGLIDKELGSSGGLNLFPRYQHFCVNAYGGYSARRNDTYFYIRNKNLPFIQNNISEIGDNVISFPGGSQVEDSLYEVSFIRDSYPQVLRNPYFRVPNDEIEGIKTYWEVPFGNMSVRKGGAYVDTAGELSGITQDVTIAGGQFYFLTIDCTVDSGFLFIDNSVFNALLKVWEGVYDYPPTKIDLDFVDYPEGIERLHNSLRITQTGQYKLLLKSRTTPYSKFELWNSDTFTGKISSVNIKRTSIKDYTNPSSGRGAVAVGGPFKVQWNKSTLAEKTLYIVIDSVAEGLTINLNIDAQLPKGVEVNWGKNATTGVDFKQIYYLEDNPSAPLTLSIGSFTGLQASPPYILPRTFAVSIRLFANHLGMDDLKVNSFTCNNNIRFIQDSWGLLFGSDVDLSNNTIKYTFAQLPFNLNSLDISNTPSEDSSLNFDAKGNITTSINLDNTGISGQFDSFIQIPTVTAINTKISSYKGNTKPLNILYSIVWKNSDIDENSLNRLLIELDFSTAEDGYLDIGGDNPPILDFTALGAIDSLVVKGWNVLYNSVVSDWTYEGVMTVGGGGELIAGWLKYPTFQYGSMNPSFMTDSDRAVIGLAPVDEETYILVVHAFDAEDNSLYSENDIILSIDNTEFTIVYDTNIGMHILYLETNPFPPVGQTCDIKLKYTLAEPYPITEIWGTQIVEVTNPITGRTWMDRNIGATRAATSSTDSEAYGHLFQWGRNPDGHELRTSGTTSTLSSGDVPGHGDFILSGSSPYDWRSPQNANLWQGIIADGWRLPTDAEWNEERLSWSSNNSAGAYSGVLKLPLAGYRYYYDGSLFFVSSIGYYWSSTVAGSYSRYLYFFSSNALTVFDYRAHGYSVRLIKDE